MLREIYIIFTHFPVLVSLFHCNERPCLRLSGVGLLTPCFTCRSIQWRGCLSLSFLPASLPKAFMHPLYLPQRILLSRLSYAPIVSELAAHVPGLPHLSLSVAGLPPGSEFSYLFHCQPRGAIFLPAIPTNHRPVFST